VLLAIDLTRHVLKEAISKKASVIVAYRADYCPDFPKNVILTNGRSDYIPWTQVGHMRGPTTTGTTGRDRSRDKCKMTELIDFGELLSGWNLGLLSAYRGRRYPRIRSWRLAC